MKTTYLNGRIYTGEKWVRNFTVENGKFVSVGCERLRDEDLGEEIVNLDGRFVCAGFNDSHMHLLNLGNLLSIADLTHHTDSMKEMLDYLRTYIEESDIAEGSWVKGRGFNHDYFQDEKRLPTRYDLDAVSTEYPICITRTCGHMCVVNSLALEMIGIHKDSSQIEGGNFAVDENGEPTGQFFENALELVYNRFPELSVEELKVLIRKGCKKLNSYGITSCQSDDYETFPNVGYKKVMQAFQELAESGELTVRVNEQAHFTNPEALKAYIAEGHHTYGDAMFKNGPLKMVGDGSLGARTAYLSRNYADGETRGIPIYTRAQLEEMCSIANREGMSIAIHAIGDGILDDILDAYEKALEECPRENHRHGIVHCQITRKDQIERMKRMGLHVYLQSIFLDYDIHIVKERVGEELAATSYQAETLLKEGITFSNGSDAPVEDPVVMKGIQCAVTRQDIKQSVDAYLPAEELSVEEAVNSFTKYGAYASFEEEEKGCMKEGMLADFVVLEDSPFTVNPKEISKIKVYETYLGGELVYEKEKKVYYRV